MTVKILIIRFSSIGDIVLTTPVIRNIKQQLNEGDVEVHYLTKKSYVSLLKEKLSIIIIFSGREGTIILLVK